MRLLHYLINVLTLCLLKSLLQLGLSHSLHHKVSISVLHVKFKVVQVLPCKKEVVWHDLFEVVVGSHFSGSLVKLVLNLHLEGVRVHYVNKRSVEIPSFSHHIAYVKVLGVKYIPYKDFREALVVTCVVS